jgi:hypothetical protein
LSGSEKFEVPEGSVAAGRRARLPARAEPPITVYVNGVAQSEGEDYRIEGSDIVFNRPIVKEGKLGAIRWLSMLIGVVGSYRKHETVDVEYRAGSQVKLASDIEIHD